jgi:hypothetical protein
MGGTEMKLTTTDRLARLENAVRAMSALLVERPRAQLDARSQALTNAVTEIAAAIAAERGVPPRQAVSYERRPDGEHETTDPIAQVERWQARRRDAVKRRDPAMVAAADEALEQLGVAP